MTQGISGTAYRLYQQHIDDLNRLEEPEPHSWDREIDRIRARDEVKQTHERHVVRLAEATAKHARQLAEAQQESGGQIDSESLSPHDRSSLLTLIALYGVAKAVVKFLARRAAEAQVDAHIAVFEGIRAREET